MHAFALAGELAVAPGGSGGMLTREVRGLLGRRKLSAGGFEGVGGQKADYIFDFQ